MAYAKKKRMSPDEKTDLIKSYREKVDEHFLSIADRVMERLVTDAKNGMPPWESPVASTSFKNPESGVNYNFENSIMLWVSSHDKEYKTNKFVTAKQGFSEGLSMEKGTTGHKIIQHFGMPFGYIYEKDNKGQIKKDHKGKPVCKRDENGDLMPIYKRACKLVTVFNLDQFTGEIPKRWLKDTLKADPLENEEDLVNFKKALIDSSEIEIARHASSKNYYSPVNDKITVSHTELFKSPLVEISTIAHEMAHATGHSSRLNRESIHRYSENNFFRGYEELVANFASRALTTHYNLPAGTHKESFESNHDSYDMGWIVPVLQKNPLSVFEAAQDSSRAFKRVNQRLQEELAKEPSLKKFLDNKDETEKEPEAKKKNVSRRRMKP